MWAPHEAHTFHLFYSESRILLNVGEPILKCHWNVTLKLQCLGLTPSNWCWVKGHIAWEVGSAHNRIGMDRNQNILLILHSTKYIKNESCDLVKGSKY